jgi:hypothetical protein
MGPEITEETLTQLVAEPARTTESFAEDGISPGRVKGWMRWLDTAIAPEGLQQTLLERAPGFTWTPELRVRVAPRKGAWQGPIPRLWHRVAERLSLLRALRAAGDALACDDDPSPLRRFLRHLWRSRRILLLFAGIRSPIASV